MELASNFNSRDFQADDFFRRYVGKMSDTTEQTLPGSTWDERLRMAFEASKMTMAELSRRSGVGYDSVNKYIRGDVKQPRGDSLDKLAEALEIDPLYLRVGLRPGPPVGEDAIPIRGKVAAGMWLEVGKIDDEPIGWLPFNPFPTHPKGSVYSLVVEGDSLDLIAPDGATIICTDLAMTGISLREEDVAIVERRRGQESLREVTAKRVKREGGELWLIPESSNPKWQTQKFRMTECADDTELRVIARLEYVVLKP